MARNWRKGAIIVGAGFSLSLDIVRISAAMAVFIAHFSYGRISGGWLSEMWAAPFAHHAVMVFFVLSGIVIAYVAGEREDTPQSFFKARFVRLYSVVLPTIVLTPMLDWIGRQADPALYDGWWYQSGDPLYRIGTALFFLHESWLSSTRYFSNGPYWSIAYEFWYYVAFGALWFLRGAKRWLALAGVFLAAGPKILLLFPVWLLGVLVWRFIQWYRPPPAIGAVTLVASVAAYILFVRTGAYDVLDDAGNSVVSAAGVWPQALAWSEAWPSYYVLAILIAACFVSLASLSEWLETLLRPAAAWIRWVAGATFTMYLMHYPMMQLVASVVPGDEDNPYRVAAMFLLILIGVFAIAEVTERRKRVFADAYDYVAEGVASLARPTGAVLARYRFPRRYR